MTNGAAVNAGSVAPMAEGFVCIGSLNGVDIFTPASTQAGTMGVQSVNPNIYVEPSIGPFSSNTGSVAPNATGLVCIGSVNGMLIYARATNSMSPMTVSPAAKGLICIGSLNGMPIYTAASAQNVAHPQQTGSFAPLAAMCG